MGSRGGEAAGEMVAPEQQLSLLDQAPRAAVGGERGPGRPKGAKNKRSAELRDWMRATGEMPVEFLARVFRADTRVLAREMIQVQLTDGEEGDGALLVKAFGFRMQAATELLPYVEQKLPTMVEDVTDRQRMVLVMGELTSDQKASLEARTGLRLVNGDGKPRAEQNQRVIDGVAVKSDNVKSDGVSK